MTAFANRTALVTGAGSGIGRAIALVLAREGAHVWLAGRTTARLDEVAELARAAGAEARVCPTDLSKPDEPRVLAERLRSAHKGLDVLVHAAGTIVYGDLESTPPAELDGQYQIHVRAPYVLTQELLPQLRAREGQIVFLNSSAALASRERITQYAAAKAAQKALADGLRAEVNPHGVRVLSVYAGRTATPMQERFTAMEGREYAGGDLVQPADVAAMVLSALTLPRTAEVTEISVRPMRKPR